MEFVDLDIVTYFGEVRYRLREDSMMDNERVDLIKIQSHLPKDEIKKTIKSQYTIKNNILTINVVLFTRSEYIEGALDRYKDIPTDVIGGSKTVEYKVMVSCSNLGTIAEFRVVTNKSRYDIEVAAINEYRQFVTDNDGGDLMVWINSKEEYEKFVHDSYNSMPIKDLI